MYFSVKSPMIGRIRRHGKTIREESITVRYLHGKSYKYSPVISKKQGNAVKRNKVKRIIREIMLSNREKYPEGYYLLYFNDQCVTVKRKNLQDKNGHERSRGSFQGQREKDGQYRSRICYRSQAGPFNDQRLHAQGPHRR